MYVIEIQSHNCLKMFCWSPSCYITNILTMFRILAHSIFPLKQCKTFIFGCLFCGEDILTLLCCKLLLFFFFMSGYLKNVFILKIWNFRRVCVDVVIHSSIHSYICFYFLTASLRCSSYTIKPIHLKGAVQWLLVWYSQSCTVIITINFRTFFIIFQRKPEPP